MQDLTKNYEKMINALSQQNFFVFTKTVLKVEWQADEVVEVDGANDGGADIKLFKNRNQVKLGIQTTIQSGLAVKIGADVKKFNDLVVNYGYSTNFLFFCTKQVDNKSQETLLESARKEYGISLNIYDSRRLAALCQDKLELKNVLFELLNLPIQEALEFDKGSKMIYDLISYNNETAQIKEHIIQCGISHILYENGETNLEIVLSLLKSKFALDVDVNFCWRMIQRLSTIRRVKIVDGASKISKLSDDEILRIDILRADYKAQEILFDREVSQVLTTWGIDVTLADKVKASMTSFVKSNYEQGVSDISDNNPRYDPKKDFDNLKNKLFLLTKFEDEDINLLVTDLVELCEKNDFILRIGAGEAFVKLSNIDKIHNYINQLKYTIYLDTQVVIYLLCAFYQKSEWTNGKYKSAVSLLDFFNEEGNKIEIKLSANYLQEVAVHFLEAVQIAPFLQHDLIAPFGGTANVYVNFYQYLHSVGVLDAEVDSFDMFLEQFSINSAKTLDRPSFLRYIQDKVEFLLKEMNIHVFNDEFYPELDLVKKELEILYAHTRRSRPNQSMRYDALMMTHLFYGNHKETEPYFISWDYSFFDFKPLFLEDHALAQQWHLFTPSSFVNHYLLLRFKLSPNSIKGEIMSLIENEFEIKNKVTGIILTLAEYINIKTKSGVAIVKKIKELRQQTMFPKAKLENNLQDEIKPIDKIVVAIYRHYREDQTGKFSLIKLKEATSSEKNTNAIISLMEEEMKSFISTHEIRQSLFEKMNAIVYDVDVK